MWLVCQARVSNQGCHGPRSLEVGVGVSHPLKREADRWCLRLQGGITQSTHPATLDIKDPSQAFPTAQTPILCLAHMLRLIDRAHAHPRLMPGIPSAP